MLNIRGNCGLNYIDLSDLYWAQTFINLLFKYSSKPCRLQHIVRQQCFSDGAFANNLPLAVEQDAADSDVLFGVRSDVLVRSLINSRS